MTQNCAYHAVQMCGKTSIEACARDIDLWMVHNRLKLNQNKMEVVFFPLVIVQHQTFVMWLSLMRLLSVLPLQRTLVSFWTMK